MGLNAFVFSQMSVAAPGDSVQLPARAPLRRPHPDRPGAFAQTFRADYQALAFGLFGAVQRVSQGLGAALAPLASAATSDGATSAGIVAMGVLALIGVPLFARWRLTPVQETPPVDQPA